MLLWIDAGLLRLLAGDGLFRGRIGWMDRRFLRELRLVDTDNDRGRVDSVDDDDVGRPGVHRGYHWFDLKSNRGIRREAVRASSNGNGLARGDELRQLLEHFSD
jgi:hypothetical protein